MDPRRHRAGVRGRPAHLRRPRPPREPARGPAPAARGGDRRHRRHPARTLRRDLRRHPRRAQGGRGLRHARPVLPRRPGRVHRRGLRLRVPPDLLGPGRAGQRPGLRGAGRRPARRRVPAAARHPAGGRRRALLAGLRHLHLGLHRQAQGCGDLPRQHRELPAGGHPDLRGDRAGPRVPGDVDQLRLPPGGDLAGVGGRRGAGRRPDRRPAVRPGAGGLPHRARGHRVLRRAHAADHDRDRAGDGADPAGQRRGDASGPGAPLVAAGPARPQLLRADGGRSRRAAAS